MASVYFSLVFYVMWALKSIVGQYAKRETKWVLQPLKLMILCKHLFCSFYHIMQALDRDTNHHFIVFDICVLAAATTSYGYSYLSGLIRLCNTICTQALFSGKICINMSCRVMHILHTTTSYKCFSGLHTKTLRGKQILFINEMFSLLIKPCILQYFL